MIILSHRGYWTTPSEKNQLTAFDRSFALGFGTETDVRDSRQRLVISHDPPGADALPLDALIERIAGRDLPLALNIKCDGIGAILKQTLDQAGIMNWFTFDMSIPDMVYQLRLGMPVFTRLSDIEPAPVLFDQAVGVWLDGFYSEWYRADLVGKLLHEGKRVCMVSPELHGRDHNDHWRDLRESGVFRAPDAMLCTDFPEDAKAFFGETT